MTWWNTSADAISTCVSILLVGYLYLIAARQPSARGRPWPVARTLAFETGIAVLIIVFGSPLAVYEDKPAVHVTQHMLLMMLAPPLLALGAPMTLLLRSLGPTGRRAVVGELRDTPLRHLSGRYAPYMIAADYYLTMYLYQLTPIRT
jgi:cytochrome c oxidase assembly factor CtaG